MSARPVHVTSDPDLLGRIDADPEAQRRGRSALIRSAVRLYLDAKERRVTESTLDEAYSGKADALLAEVDQMLGGQVWPSD